MKYILDFDRVLFDTDRFKAFLQDVGLGELPREETLLVKIEEAGINWKEFVNQDVLKFLRENGKDCIVVSSHVSRNRKDNNSSTEGRAFFQNEKIKRAGVTDLVHEVRITGAEKQEALTELIREHGENLVFLDDEPAHVRAAEELGYRAILFSPTETTSHVGGSEECTESGRSERVTAFREFVKLMGEGEKKAA
jgi:hypothetical protein